MKSQNEFDAVTRRVEETLHATNARIVAPVRHTLVKRFPVTSVLLIAFGVSATATGAELLFVRVPLFREHPLVLLLLGLGVLVLMGKLHQKLG